ncbi:helix-turn-helix domain-containing protein [Ureibacillus sp. MALMAid1270]|uniref:helix-turn-helix domain-containing protein n=1 Tax=Ureibacillus sp. MALMAid1270 TaxID=3411629 RepID=UPI003BA57499
MKKFIQGEPGIVFDVNKANNHFKQKENFGERIKKIRENKKFTVQEMAEQLKVSNGYLIKTENNQTEPSKFFIQTLAWVCGMEYDDLLDELYYIEQGNLLK